MMKTLSQRDLEMAAQRVSEIRGSADGSWRKTYGGLCHSFPVLVRSAGLAQALVFYQSKATGDNAEAHKRLLEDFDTLLPGFDVGRSPLSEYAWATRRVLAAWVFYKRFAVSILKVDSGEGNDVHAS